jgi:hypothetical protein
VAPYDPKATAALLANQQQQSVDPNATAANPAAAPAPAHFVSAAAQPAAKPSEMKYTPRPEQSQPTTPAPAGPETMDPSKRVMLGGQGQGGQQPFQPMPGPTVTGGGGPVKVIPGKRTPQSWATTTEQGVQLSPETQGLYQSAEEKLRQAQGLVGEATAEERAYQKGEALRSAGEKARDWVEDKNRQEARDQQMAAAQAKLEAAKKIDPNRLWDSKSGFSKAMDLIGSVAGGILQGMGITSTNQNLEKLSREIDRDVQLQLKNLDQAKEDVQAYYGQWDREDQRLAAGRLAKMQDAKDRISTMLSGSQDKRIQASLIEASAALDRRMADDQKTLAKETQGKVVTQQHDVMTKPQVVGGGGRKVDWSATAAEYRRRGGDDKTAKEAIQNIATANGVGLDQARAIFYGALGHTGIPTGGHEGGGTRPQPGDPSLYVPGAFAGSGGFARTLEDAKKAKEVNNAGNQLMKNLTRIQDLRNETVLNRVSPSARAEVESLAAQNTLLLKNLETLGVLSEGDMKLVAPLTGAGGLDIISPGMDRSLAVGLSGIQNKVNAFNTDYGLVPGTETVRNAGLSGKVTGTSRTATPAGTTPFKKAGE